MLEIYSSVKTILLNCQIAKSKIDLELMVNKDLENPQKDALLGLQDELNDLIAYFESEAQNLLDERL